MAVYIVVELLILLLLQPWLITVAVTPEKPKIARSNCTDRCGNVNVAYPFGIEVGCYMNDWFRVTCNTTNGVPKPFIASINLELINVSYSLGTVLVSNPVTQFNCSKKDNGIPFSIFLGSNSPFFFPNVYNRFASTGCGKWMTICRNKTTVGGCLLPNCRDQASINGCHTSIPPTITSFVANLTNRCGASEDNNGCGSAFMIADGLLNSDGSVPKKIRNLTHVPAVLQWSIPIMGMCDWKNDSSSFCDGDGDGEHCWRNLSSTHFCVCSKSTEIITQLSDCQAFGKCMDGKHKFCQMLCLTAPGKFDCTWPCPDGYESYNNRDDNCYPKDLEQFLGKKSRVKAMIIGWSTGVGTLFLLIGSLELAKRRKKIKQKKDNFKRNGGLLLTQKLSSPEGTVETIRLFTSDELANATDNYSVRRILGQGGQGTVYKGMLADGSIVAIKKPKRVGIGEKLNEKIIQDFINEMIILSQINHRNIVKLLGCCLETEVPLLVYEFIINGTLSQHIHEEDEELFPIRWEMRLRIAVEVANALAYLHSSASTPIYHRDIKSSNILLDDKYRAKVSDFGTSRSIAAEQTHLTTQIQGTFGYLDPEYFYSSQFTEKSDVYSFGVVLAELLTGKKPIISSSESEEARSLASWFLHSMKEHLLFDMLDHCVIKDGPEYEIMAVAELAQRCLNLSGKERPAMKEVAMQLELIRVSKDAHAIQKCQDQDCDDDQIEPRTIPSPSSSINYNCTSSIPWPLDARP